MALTPDVQALIDELLRKIERLEQENAELRRRLGLDSSNSSKPPSSDGLGRKPGDQSRRSGSLRGKSGKESGGQKGHRGDTLRRSESPDKVVHHHADTCKHCQASLDTSHVVGVEKRQVHDLPEPKLEVTEHRADICLCAQCSKITKADFPEGVNAPAQYGPRIRAAAIYFNVQQLIPEDRTADIMTDLFEAPSLCPATIASWVAQKAAAFEPVVEAIEQKLRETYCRHLDETGFRIKGKTQWLHTVSNGALTYYATSAKRGDIPLFLQDSKGGVIVHDHFRSYYKKFAALDHALCNAHHLRELKALIEIDGEAWAGEMSELLVSTNSLKRQAVERGDRALPSSLLQGILDLYDHLVEAGLAFHHALPPLERSGQGGKPPRRPGHNLLRRLRDFKDDVLRFARDLAVPFTNNQAEQDLRMMKLRMKISGGFRSEQGAQSFATVRSVLATARKHGWSILQTLSAQPATIVQALNTAG